MASIAAALHDLLNESDLAVEDTLTRYFTDDFRQSTNGDWIDRSAFAEQMSRLRLVIDRAEIRVVQELSSGSGYAERHVLTATMRDGSAAAQEVFLFAEIADDGRFASLEELVRPLTDD